VRPFLLPGGAYPSPRTHIKLKGGDIHGSKRAMAFDRLLGQSLHYRRGGQN
jgi:hypothetical protein